MSKLRPKINCEICGETNKRVLDRHHIIPRKHPLSTDNDYNLAVICSNCHRKVHNGEYIIEGVFKTSKGKELIWRYPNENYIMCNGVIFHKDGKVEVDVSWL